MDWSNHILERKEMPFKGRVPTDGAFDVDKVYPGSLAAAAGVLPDMVYLARDKQTPDWLLLSDRRQYLQNRNIFVDLRRGMKIELLTMGFPFGLELRRTVDSLCTALGNDYTFYSEEILERAHDGNENVLAQLVAALEKPARSVSPIDFVHRIFGKSDPIRRRDFVLQMVAGVYHALQGGLDHAQMLMTKFENEYVAATIMTSLNLYGRALIAEARNAPPDEVDALLYRALDGKPDSLRIRRHIEKRTGQLPEEPAKTHPRPFPLNYSLLERDPLNSADPLKCRFVGFNQTLASLVDDQFLIVVSLSSYRGNHYYVQLLQLLAQIYPLIGKHFPAVHIVTSHEKGGRHFDVWLSGERTACRVGVPVQILSDPEDFVPAILEARGSPNAVIVNKRGVIVYQGELQSEEGYWTALSTIDQA